MSKAARSQQLFRHFPALLQAMKLREVVAQIGFVPLDAEVVRLEWVAETESIVQAAVSDLSPAHLGRLLFLLAEYALALNPKETLLQEENQQYRSLVTDLEKKLLQVKSSEEGVTPLFARSFYLECGKSSLD